MTRTIALLATPLLLAGCLSLGGKTPETLLTLKSEAALPAGTARNAEAGQVMTILVPQTSQALQTTRIPVASGGNNLAYLKEAYWSDNPARLFQQLLTETVSARTGRVVLDARQFTFDPGTRLAGQLQNFGLDAVAMQAVVTYDAALGRDGGKVETRRFEARVPLAAIDGPSAGAALNQAANTVAGEVAAWVGA